MTLELIQIGKDVGIGCKQQTRLLLNVYSHNLVRVYMEFHVKPLQDCDYRQNNLTKERFHARIKVLIV
jgi:hypothetical protein